MSGRDVFERILASFVRRWSAQQIPHHGGNGSCRIGHGEREAGHLQTVIIDESEVERLMKRRGPRVTAVPLEPYENGPGTPCAGMMGLSKPTENTGGTKPVAHNDTVFAQVLNHGLP